MYKLLVLFLGLLSLISALPQPGPAPIDIDNFSAGSPPVETQSLTARAPTAAFKAFIAQIEAAKEVVVGSSAFYTFAQQPKGISSAGFDGCIGAMIVGTEGAIVSHYTVTASAMTDAKKEIAALWTAHKSELGGTTPRVMVYANVQATNHNAYVEPTIAEEFISLVHTTTGVAPTVQKYLQMGDTCVDAAGELLDDADYDHMQAGAIFVGKVNGVVKEEWVTITQQKECVGTLGVGSA